MKLVLFFVVALAVASAAAASSVVVLDADSFDSVISENEHVLVEFYAPWCGHCKRLAPEYEKAAAALDGVAVLANVNADEETNKALAAKYGVRGYPTLKWFVNGEVSDYTGGREEATLISWVEKKVLPASAALADVESAKTLIAENPTVVIGFFAEESGEDYKSFLGAAASDVFTSQKFAHVVDASIAAALDAEVGSVEVYQDGTESAVGKFDEEDFSVKNFLFDVAFPLVEEVSRDVYQRLMKKGNPIVITFFDSEDTEIADFVNENAEAHKSELSFTTADEKTMGQTASRMGASGEVFPVALVIVVSEDEQSQTVINWDEEVELTKESYTAWIEAVVDGTAVTWTKSEPIPDENDGPVKVVVAKNFDDVVLDSTKDVLVEFYAPWCGHCKSLAPIYESVGKALQDAGVDSVVVAKMDATANGLNEVVQPLVSGFPTLIFFRADDKTPLEFDAGRDADSILAFIDENASIDFDVSSVQFAAEDDDEDEEDEDDIDEDDEDNQDEL